jgi:hypothetical protein
MSKTTGIPVKTRLPLTAWVLAGLVTLFSLVTAALHVTTIPEPPVSVANQETPATADYRADGAWAEPKS